MRKLTLLFLAIVTAAFLHTVVAQDTNKTDAGTNPGTTDKTTTDTTKKDETKANTFKDTPVDPIVGLKKEDMVADASKNAGDAGKTTTKDTPPPKPAKSFVDGHTTYINATVKFELSTKDNIAENKIVYKIDEGQPQDYTAPFSVTGEGKHTITYHSVDKLGNQENSKNFTVVLDDTGPEVTVTIEAPFINANNVIYVSSAVSYKYSITAVDKLSGVATIRYSEDGKDPKEYVGSFTSPTTNTNELKIVALDNVDNANVSYTKKVVDLEGKILGESKDVKIVVDSTAPEIIIAPDKPFIELAGKKVASKEYKYTITAADKESGVGQLLYRVDKRGDFMPYTEAIAITTNGEHTIEAIAKDKVGNSTQIQTLVFYVDTLPSESTIKIAP